MTRKADKTFDMDRVWPMGKVVKLQSWINHRPKDIKDAINIRKAKEVIIFQVLKDVK